MRFLDYKVKRPLSNEELTAILDGIKGADTHQVALLRALTVFDILLADVGLTCAGLRQAGIDLKPTCLQIPAHQWHQICQALMDWSHADAGDPSAIARTNLGLSWMNYGPSGYTDPKEKTA